MDALKQLFVQLNSFFFNGNNMDKLWNWCNLEFKIYLPSLIHCKKLSLDVQDLFCLKVINQIICCSF